MTENNSNEQKNSDGDKWSIPFTIGIDKLDKIAKALFQQEADKQAVTVGKLHSLTEISGHNKI